MKSHFEHLRQQLSNESNKVPRFEEELFPPCPWDIIESTEENVKKEVDSYRVAEKLETIQALAQFVEEQGEKKVEFPGGEIRHKIDNVEEDYIFSSPAPAKEAPPVNVLVLGDLLERGDDVSKAEEVNLMLSKMISAMKFSDGEVARKPSLRYYIDEENIERSDEVIQRMMQFIYRKQIQVVLAFGALEARSLLGRRVRLASIHGKLLSKTLRFSDGTEHKFIIVPVFHPEYLRVNPQMRQTTWQDLQGVMRFLGKM